MALTYIGRIATTCAAGQLRFISSSPSLYKMRSAKGCRQNFEFVSRGLLPATPRLILSRRPEPKFTTLLPWTSLVIVKYLLLNKSC